MAEILERPQAPTRRRFDVDAYYRMAEAGVLGDPCRVELIDGEIIDMAAIGSPHAAVTNRLARLFTRALRDDASLVNVQSPLRLDAYNEPELPPRQGLTDSATDADGRLGASSVELAKPLAAL